MARKVDELWTKCRNPTDLDLDTSFCTRWSGSSQLASDKPCRGQHVLEQSYTAKPTRSVDQLCEMCPSSTSHRNDVSVDSVIGFSPGGSEANVTSERQRLTAKAVRDMIVRSRRTEASKEETETTNNDRVQHCLQLWNGIQCDDELGNSSAPENFRHHHHLSPPR